MHVCVYLCISLVEEVVVGLGENQFLPAEGSLLIAARREEEQVI